MSSVLQEGGVVNTAALSDEGYVTSREDMDDELDLSWSTVLKRTFEAYLRVERPNMYGEWITWDQKTGTGDAGKEEKRDTKESPRAE